MRLARAPLAPQEQNSSWTAFASITLFGDPLDPLGGHPGPEDSTDHKAASACSLAKVTETTLGSHSAWLSSALIYKFACQPACQQWWD